MKFKILILLWVINSCSYQIKIKTGDQAFQSKQYSIAQNLYHTEFEQTNNQKQKAYIAFKLGQSYKYVSDFGQSLKWFKIAFDLNYGLKALEEYAFALKNNGEYEAAIAAFQELSIDIALSSEIRKEITFCNLNIQWKLQQNDQNYSLTKLKAVNELSSDYSAVKDPLGVIYFVSDRLNESAANKTKDGWSGRFFSDIYMFSEKGIKTLDRNINSEFSEGPFCFNSKMTELYFTRCEDRKEMENFCKIYLVSRLNNTWSEPMELNFGLENCNQIHPSLHYSDSILIFSSDEKNGLGQYDLYLSYRIPEGWSVAQNLGSVINTSKDEKFPVWYRDTLFFSSTGHVGMGGLDVFRSYLANSNDWYPPLNLKPSINSEADDFSFFVDTSFVSNDSIQLKGLLSSNRGPVPNDEIYSVELINKKFRKKDSPKEKFKLEIIAAINFVGHEHYRDHKTIELDSVNLVEKVSKRSVSTGSANTLNLKLLPDENYTFLASKKNYLNKEFSFSTPGISILDRDTTIRISHTVEMLPILYDTEFILKELYYDFDEWTIRKDAIKALEDLHWILTTNPTISVMLGAHTDCRGDEKYNEELSAKRAKSAMDWLIQQGIDSSRLKYIGYGETHPSVNCLCVDCSESDHQMNRRTTFKLIKKEK